MNTSSKREELCEKSTELMKMITEEFDKGIGLRTETLDLLKEVSSIMDELPEFQLSK